MKLGTWLDVSEDLHSTLQSALQHRCWFGNPSCLVWTRLF